MEKCEKEKGNKERIASCSFCPLYIRFLSFLAVFFCHFLPVEACKRKHISHSKMGNHLQWIYRKWDHRVWQIRSYPWALAGFLAAIPSLSPGTLLGARLLILPMGTIFWDAQKPRRFLSRIRCVKSNRNIPHWRKITPLDWRNFQPMPQKIQGVRPSWRITPLIQRNWSAGFV